MLYLTKIDNKKLLHYRISINNNGIDVVEGHFYNWISKHWTGCGNLINAEKELQNRVNNKLGEGFVISEFIETLENSVDVYDKAKWHFDGDFPKELNNFQGYIHTGMFVGWLIDSDLISDEFKNGNISEIQDFKNKKLTGSQIYETCCDGVLMLEDIGELGNRFGLQYFDFTTGQYLKDYEDTLAKDLLSMYHVNDTWDNYKKIKIVIDKKFKDWNKQNYKSFWNIFR